MGPEPLASASPENLVDMQILGLHFRPGEPGALGVEPSNVCVASPAGDPDGEKGRGLIFI